MSSLGVHPDDLQPSLVPSRTFVPRTYISRTYGPRRFRVRIDVAAMISVMVCLLYLMPATMIVPQMTFAGRPALLLALGLFAWWVIARLSPGLLLIGPQPLRWASLFYLLSILLAYLAGMLRGLPIIELNRQDFTVLVTFQFLGVILMVADGIPNWERLRGVLRVFVWCAGIMAVIGFIQSTFQLDITEFYPTLGLQLKSELADFQGRGDAGLVRVAGTTFHYIEFSTVMAMAVPFALHFVRFAPKRSSRQMYAIITLLIAAAVPLAISRTGVVALVAVMAVMAITVWNWRMIYNIMLLAGALVGTLMVAKPGLLGTLKAMFVYVGLDPSISGRTDDYAQVGRWFAERPWLGRGPGTLIPDLYLTLDNQWLMTLITGGIVGVAALVVLHATCIALAIFAMRRASRDEDRHLCGALLSSQVVAILVGFTFDSFSFTTFSFSLALMSGICGTVWRLTHPARMVRTSTVDRLFLH